MGGAIDRDVVLLLHTGYDNLGLCRSEDLHLNAQLRVHIISAFQPRHKYLDGQRNVQKILLILPGFCSLESSYPS